MGWSILIVEDHELLAESLALGLSEQGFECVVATLSGGPTVLQQAARQRPALVLLDLQLGDSDGLELIPGLRALGAQVLVVTGYTETARLAAALTLGASAWVAKTEPFARLLEAAASLLHERQPACDAKVDAELSLQGTAWLENNRETRRQLDQLTPREREVLWALSEGETAAEIARALVVSIGTVRSHIQSILGKLEVSSQLALVAKTRSLLSPGRDWQPRRSTRTY